MKVIIVGGVAGGASCAARLRRLDEKAEILMVERRPYVSYANCGLPYHVGGVIPKESSLLVANEQYFQANLAIDVRTNCEAIAIWPKKKTVDRAGHGVPGHVLRAFYVVQALIVAVACAIVPYVLFRGSTTLLARALSGRQTTSTNSEPAAETTENTEERTQ